LQTADLEEYRRLAQEYLRRVGGSEEIG
jgi:hypothetical protein